MPGMSRRAYARSRKMDESTVRKHLKSGALAGAVLPDGTIDPEKADAALRDGRTRGKSVPVSLQVAKLRRERALAMREVHELGKIRTRHSRPDDYADQVAEMNALLATVFRSFPRRLAAMVYGQTARTINATLKHAVNDLLGEAQAAVHQRMAEHEREFAEPPESEEHADLGSMSPTELAAHRATVQAEIHERGLAIELGVLRPSDDLLLIVAEMQSVVKSRLWALSGRLDVALANAADLNAAEKLLSAEIEEIVAIMDEPVRRIRSMQPKEAA